MSLSSFRRVLASLTKFIDSHSGVSAKFAPGFVALVVEQLDLGRLRHPSADTVAWEGGLTLPAAVLCQQ